MMRMLFADFLQRHFALQFQITGQPDLAKTASRMQVQDAESLSRGAFSLQRQRRRGLQVRRVMPPRTKRRVDLFVAQRSQSVLHLLMRRQRPQATSYEVMSSLPLLFGELAVHQRSQQVRIAGRHDLAFNEDLRQQATLVVGPNGDRRDQVGSFEHSHLQRQHAEQQVKVSWIGHARRLLYGESRPAAERPEVPAELQRRP